MDGTSQDLDSRTTAHSMANSRQERKIFEIHEDSPDTTQLTLNDEAARLMVNPDKVRKRHDPMDLVVLAREVQRGDEMVKAGASHKLMLIADQIRHLQMQAREVV